MDLLKGFFHHWNQVHKVTLKVFEAIPEDKLHFKATPELMSLLDLAAHLYIGERVFTQGIAKGTVELADFKRVTEEAAVTDKKRLLEFARQVHDETNGSFQGMSLEDLSKPVKVFWGEEQEAFVMLSGVYDHHLHHRGQMYTYIRLLGIKPPDVFSYEP